MKTLLACLLLLVLPTTASAKDDPKVSPSVRIDARVETASVMARLAGFEEFQAAGIPEYDAAVDAHFATFRGHPSIQVMRKLRESHGIGYAAPIELALAADPVDWKPAIELRPRPAFLDARWDAAAAEAFLAAAREFDRDAGASAFFAAQRSVHERAEAAFTAALGTRLDVTWFRQMTDVPVDFTIVPALLAGPNNYGVHQLGADGRMHVFGLIGTPTHQAGEPITYPGDAVLALLAHEFHHPFVNPWVDANADKLLPASEELFQVVREQMEPLAYGKPRIVLYESLVRAHTQRYLRRQGENAVLARAMLEDRRNGFLWTPDLAEALDATDREAPHDEVARVAGVASLFQAWGRDAGARITAERERLAAEKAAREAAGPRIIRRSPGEGASVTAGEHLLELLFDRPMASSLAIFGDVPDVVGKPSWSDDKRTLSIPVRLAAGTRYRLQLNSEEALHIKSQDGAPMPPSEWTFETTAEAPRE